MSEHCYIRDLDELRSADALSVGGKNAALGELAHALRAERACVPAGFAVTTEGYWVLVAVGGIGESIAAEIDLLRRGVKPLAEAGAAIRGLFESADLPRGLAQAIARAYRELSRRAGAPDGLAVAVRSSAAAEDLPGASFAGQHETFLNVRGEPALLAACKRCYASLFTDRAIRYRERMGLDPQRVALSIGVQAMVRADLAGAGVLFTCDPESGFADVAQISAAWGLGPAVAQGTVNPDLYTVFKPLLGRGDLRPILDRRLGGQARKLVYRGEGGGGGATGTTVYIDTTCEERQSCVLGEPEILQLARWGAAAERHHGMPMNLEWAKDGATGQLFLVQARPESGQALHHGLPPRTYRLRQPATALVRGAAVGTAMVTGTVRHLSGPAAGGVIAPGSILVTATTDPGWAPLLQQGAGIVTDFGGPTCHAAIVARELGIPAVVGTGNATRLLAEGQPVTLSCAEGESGKVYAGSLPFDATEIDVEALPATRVRTLLDVADPAAAFRWWRLARGGIGPVRLDRVLSDLILAEGLAARRPIEGDGEPSGEDGEHRVELLARGIAKLAATCFPAPAYLELSEPRPGRLALECRAVVRARQRLGLTNLALVVPPCRSLADLDATLAELAAHGLERGHDGLQIHVRRALAAGDPPLASLAERCDGVFLGSRDLIPPPAAAGGAAAGDPPLPGKPAEASQDLIRQVVRAAHAAGLAVGLRNLASDAPPELISVLVDGGVDSLTLDPHSMAAVRRRIADRERQREPRQAPPARRPMAEVA